MCLLLGPISAGKTLLTKKLETYLNSPQQDGSPGLLDTPATISTIGTILVNVPVNRKQEVTVREVGGSMGPIWQNYFKDCTALMFIIDISNRLQTAAACIQLLSVLSSNKLSSTAPVLVIFNKIDMPEKMSFSEIDSLFRLSDIIQHSSQPIQTVEVSAVTGQGLLEVIRWLERNCSTK